MSVVDTATTNHLAKMPILLKEKIHLAVCQNPAQLVCTVTTTRNSYTLIPMCCWENSTQDSFLSRIISAWNEEIVNSDQGLLIL